MIYQGKAKYTISGVVLHTADCNPETFLRDFPTAEAARAEIDRWHRARGWSGFGYHCLVMPYGTRIFGRALSRQGAHVKEANRGTLGIVMINRRRHNGIRTFDHYFTAAQRATVKKTIAEWQKNTAISWVRGHNDFTNMKECPGFKVRSEDWLPSPEPKGFWGWLKSWF